MTTKEFQKEFDSMKGQMVLYDDKVYHWIGIGEDDHDFFYILLNRDKLMLGSPIAGVWQLKDKIDERHYKDLIHTAKYNWQYSYNSWAKRVLSGEQFNLYVAHEKQKLIDRILAPRSKNTFFIVEIIKLLVSYFGTLFKRLQISINLRARDY